MVMNTEINAETVVSAVAGIGAVNWGLQEFASFNIVTELLGSSPELGYGAFAVAGVVVLTERFELTEMFG